MCTKPDNKIEMSKNVYQPDNKIEMSKTFLRTKTHVILVSNE